MLSRQFRDMTHTGKGENEQYLVRNAFLNWDKDASGKLDYEEFRADSAPISWNFST